MKKILLPLMGLACIFTACEDRLDIEQKGVITTDMFYNTDDDAQNALNNVYQSLVLNVAGWQDIYVPLPMLFNEMGDDMLAAGSFYGDNDYGAALNEFRYDSSNIVIKTAYWGLFGVIYECNNLLDRVGDDSPVKKRVRAEARSVRAWCHFMLTIGWGCPALVDHVLPGDAKPSNYEGGHEGLLKWCAEEAEACVNDLDERTAPTDKVGASKITKGFALTLAGKARLFLGEYDAAKRHLKQVIISRKYELVPASFWPNLFHISGDLCEEMIFQINVVYNPNMGTFDQFRRSSWQFLKFWNWRTDKLASFPAFLGAEGWGGCGIRTDFAEDMLANDGDSPRRKATFLTPDEFFYEMEWKGSEGLSRAELETSDQIGIKDKTGLYGFGGYFPTKHLPWVEDIDGGLCGYRNLTLFRYAEVLLMYAEACAMTSDNDGLQYLQAVQNRAGSNHVSTSLTLNEVKNEKRFEMWLESVRFPDMVRWGDTDGLANNGKNIPTTYDAFFTKDEPKHRIYVEYSNPNQGETGFKKGVHEYFPFPLAETSINPNLKQNPSGL